MNSIKDKIQRRLEELIPKEECSYKILFEAARYALLAPAKRIRPTILLSILSAFGVPLDKGLDTACALEMIHNYSLIHDDLPCMDNDDIRRGMPTVHKAFGEAQAVLTGDFLLTLAFDVVARCVHLNDHQKIQIIQTLGKHAGASGLIGGQVLDISSENKVLSEEELREIHDLKTAALFVAAFECSAIIAQLSISDTLSLKECGFKIGLAYQIHDDLEDKKEKHSASILTFGMEKAKNTASKLLFSAKEQLNQLPHAVPFIESLIHQLRKNTHEMEVS